jgi:exodeoxyribonuclease III
LKNDLIKENKKIKKKSALKYIPQNSSNKEIINIDLTKQRNKKPKQEKSPKKSKTSNITKKPKDDVIVLDGDYDLLEKESQIEEYQFPDTSLSLADLPEIPENKELKIVAWNVNGIRAIMKKGKLQEFLQQENPDFFCLSETKIDDEKLLSSKHHKLFSDQYFSFWNCCKVKKGYSGVAIFTKYKPLSIKHGIDHHEHDQEGRVLTLEFNNFYLVGVYVPNAGCGCKRLVYRVNSWDNDFQNYIHNLKTKKDVVVCGDMNVAHHPIDLAHPKANEGCACFTVEERNSLSKFLNAGYIDTFRHLYPSLVKYSHFSSRIKTNIMKYIGWRLDYFICNKEAINRVVDSQILDFYRGSDHTPIKLRWKS